MKVLIDARIRAGRMGGVQQVVSGLAGALSQLPEREQISYLTQRDDAWLRPCVRDSAIVHARGAKSSPRMAVDALRRRLLAGSPSFRRFPIPTWPVPGGGTWAPSGRYDIVHFVTQQGFQTDIPSVYSPYDLLHLHHPEFFDAREVARREKVYRFLVEQAHSVVMMTAWGRDDLVERYGVPPAKVHVVPLGMSSPPVVDSSLRLVEAKYQLPSTFALYPAHTWPHKNHLRLLEALAVLRDRGVTVPIVCTGQQDQHVTAIRDAVDSLRLNDQVFLLGRVPEVEMPSLFKLARCVVFPSLFEGWGLPVFEAFASGVPVACSNIRGLVEQAEGAAALFDPFDVEAMAEVIGAVFEDSELRRTLVGAGRRRIRTLTWRRTAAAYLALYREAAGEVLSDLDRVLVAASRDGRVEAVPMVGEETRHASASGPNGPA